MKYERSSAAGSWTNKPRNDNNSSVLEGKFIQITHENIFYECWASQKMYGKHLALLMQSGFSLLSYL